MSLRFKPAKDTLSELANQINRSGITRLSDLSYMDDSTDLYVYSAIRPGAKSITVSMGKATTIDEAKCAALMESIETFYAEEVKPTKLNISQNELIANDSLFVDINRRGYQASIALEHPIDWCIGKTLISNQEIFIPHVALTLDSTSLLSKIIGSNSDGIASGTNYQEALIYSFLELVERGAINASSKKQITGIPGTILSALKNSGLKHACYLHENPFHLPVFECNLLNENPMDNQAIMTGFACHFSSQEAIKKAFNEAIQSKIGVISGARDDLTATCYNFKRLIPFVQVGEKVEFNTIESFNLSLTDQYNYLINLLISLNKDLAVYVYYEDEITVIKTFLIDNDAL